MTAPALAANAASAARGRLAVAAMFLVNGFAPVVHSIAWLRYFTVFHYYAGHDPAERAGNADRDGGERHANQSHLGGGER